MTFILRAYPNATLPAHNATTTDISGVDGDAHEMTLFENTYNSPGSTVSSARVQTVSVNGEPWMRFTHPTDFIRCEVANWDTTPGIPDGVTYWHAVSLIIRQGGLVAGGSSKIANLTQVHQKLNLPPFGIYFDRGGSGGTPYRFRFHIQPGGTNVTLASLSALPLGERIDCMWVTKYSHSSGTCSMYWRRSSDINDYTGAFTGPISNNGVNMNSGTALYFKQGCYRPDTPGDGSTWIVDHKGYYVATTQAEVETLYGTASSPPTPDPPPDATRVGVSVAGASFNAMGADRFRFSDFTMTESGLVNEVVCYMDGAGGAAGSQTFKYFIYSGTAKVAETGDIVISSSSPTARWEDANLLVPYQASNGESLSIGIHSSTTANVARYAYEAETDALLFGTDTYSDGTASTLPSTSLDAKRLSIYGVYTPGADPPPDPPATGGPRGYAVGGRSYSASARSYQSGAKVGVGGGV